MRALLPGCVRVTSNALHANGAGACLRIEMVTGGMTTGTCPAKT